MSDDFVSAYIRDKSEVARTSRAPAQIIELFPSPVIQQREPITYPADCTAKECEVLGHSYRALEALLDFCGGPEISEEMIARVDGLTNRARWRVECIKAMRRGE